MSKPRAHKPRRPTARRSRSLPNSQPPAAQRSEGDSGVGCLVPVPVHTGLGGLAQRLWPTVYSSPELDAQTKLTWLCPAAEAAAIVEYVRLADDGALRSLVGQVVEIDRVASYDEERVDEETGELHRYQSYVLITPAGTRLKCSSIGVGACLIHLLLSRGPGPWDPPARLVVRQRPSKTHPERQVLYLDRADNPLLGGGV